MLVYSHVVCFYMQFTLLINISSFSFTVLFIVRILTEWGLWNCVSDHSIHSITTDNAANMIKTLEIMMQKTGPGPQPLKLRWFGCSAHLLQLCLKDAFKEAPKQDTVVKRCHNLTMAFHLKTYLGDVLHQMEQHVPYDGTPRASQEIFSFGRPAFQQLFWW